MDIRGARRSGSRIGVLPEPAGMHFDMEHDLLCTAGADGCFTSLNAAWETVLGWTATS